MVEKKRGIVEVLKTLILRLISKCELLECTIPFALDRE